MTSEISTMSKKVMNKTDQRELVERIERLAMTVSAEFMVPVKDLFHVGRGPQGVADARAVAMYHAVNRLGMTQDQVQKVFGRGDRSSVSAAIGKVVCRMREDPEYYAIVKNCEAFER